jgi:hypothetical protein
VNVPAPMCRSNLCRHLHAGLANGSSMPIDDHDGPALPGFLKPALSPVRARCRGGEGWTLGVAGSAHARADGVFDRRSGFSRPRRRNPHPNA